MSSYLAGTGITAQAASDADTDSCREHDPDAREMLAALTANADAYHNHRIEYPEFDRTATALWLAVEAAGIKSRVLELWCEAAHG